MRVWVNGTFDILHMGHIRMLEYASLFGEVRVGIDSDARVAEKKGAKRPFNTLHDRIAFLQAIKYVQTVVSFDSDDELVAQIKYYMPETMVIGEEYRTREIIGASHVPNILFYPRVGAFSTSNILSHE